MTRESAELVSRQAAAPRRRVLRATAVEPLSHDEIARLAHELWQARGCPHGSAEVDWLRAEQELQREINRNNCELDFPKKTPAATKPLRPGKPLTRIN